MTNKNLIHHLIDRYEKLPTHVAIQYKDRGRWHSYRWQDVFHLVGSLAAGLADQGVVKGDRIAIMSETRPEWFISDLSIMGLGAITIPIYPNVQSEEVDFILTDSGTKILILEDQEQFERWEQILSNHPNVKIVVMTPKDLSQEKDWITWSSLLEIGRTEIKTNKNFLQHLADNITLDDIATIPYTSGTTGRPKGVVLAHEQIMSELEDVFSIIPVNEKDLSLTFLPLSHILGRVEAWGSIFAGYALGFAESTDKLRSNLIELKPTFLIAVPRIFEKLYAAIISQTENNVLKKKLFQAALAVGKKHQALVRAKLDIPISLALQYQAFDKLVFQTIREKLGGRIRFAVSGGAPLSGELAEFFHAVGLLILEGYGLTETTAGACFNSPLKYKLGTVGPALADVQIKIAEDGEILIRSKKVMKSYYNNPEATAAAIVDSYLKTGDIGEVDSEGFLKITDRKKDLIKTAGGKYVAPQKLEALLKRNPLISNVLIHGDHRKYIVALIALNQASVEDYAQRNELKYSDYKKFIDSREIQKRIKETVSEANAELASYESIKKFHIVDTDFTIENGALTPSLKVKRKVVETKYKKELDDLYEG